LAFGSSFLGGIPFFFCQTSSTGNKKKIIKRGKGLTASFFDVGRYKNQIRRGK
jgi:hypothetical protein